MLKIEKWEENKILRDISEKIKKDEMKKYIRLGQEMIKYIKNPKHMGVGLAAPQVGYNKRLIVVSLLKDWDDENYQTIMMINPEITDFSDDCESDVEWCLSIPGERGSVQRAKSIKLEYIDIKWKHQKIKISWVSARIIQHEIDHLNGVLFTDRVHDPLLEKEKKYA